REVALKVLPLLQPERVARFELEVEALVRLQHPNVVRIHSAGQHGRSAYLVMDLVEGRTLEQRFQELGPFPGREACFLVAKLADAVQAVHDAGLLHRDLKPANVILREDGEPVLVDFGIAKQIDPGLQGPTRTGAMIGSPGYWSPEQASGSRERIAEQSDVYGLGAILYACLTARPPFVAPSMAELMVMTATQAPEPPSAFAQVEREIERICLACLAKEPGQRYASAGALAEDLRRVVAGSSAQHLPARGRKGAGIALSIGVLGLALSAGILAWGVGGGEAPDPAPAVNASAQASPTALPSQTSPQPTPPDLGPTLAAALPGPALHQEARRLTREIGRELTSRYPALARIERRARLLPLRGLRANMVDLALQVRYREDTRPTTAAVLYQAAVELGDERAWTELGVSIGMGEAGAPLDPGLRSRMLLLALGWRSLPATDALAGAWLTGHGLPRDLALSAAARQLALAFGHTQSRTQAQELERAGVSLPPRGLAWSRMRAEAARAAQVAPVPYEDRGPPPPQLARTQLAARVRPFLAWLPLRFPAFAELLARAEALPHDTPAAWEQAVTRADDPAQRAALALRPMLQGYLGRLPELAQAFLRGEGAPRDPLLGRLLLAFDVEHRPGRNASMRCLVDAFLESQPEVAAACARLIVARAPREVALLLPIPAAEISEAEAWRVFWRAQRADLQAAGLLGGAPPALALPARLSEVPRSGASARGGARLTWLSRYVPALQWLERERQATPRPQSVALALKQAQVAHDPRRHEALRMHLARADDLGAMRDLIAALGHGEGLPTDRVALRRLMLELTALGDGGAAASLQQLHPELVAELRVISAELGHKRSREFVAGRRSLGEALPSPEEAWSRLRAASADWLAQPLSDALVRAAPLRKAPWRRARLRATVQALGARWPQLGAALAAPPPEVSAEALARARAANERELALRIAVALALPGKAADVLRLVKVLDDDPSLVAPALALTHAVYDLSGEADHLRRLTGFYRNQGLLALSALCATLAGELGAERELRIQLPWLAEEARERAFAYERERAYACAGLPALDLPSR
ncbi:MAG TPA: hypothetical protein DEA08_20850, partial [Planctomycetes bacterium]|nr:hypothetical protein [Planctomycetota bacterium]